MVKRSRKASGTRFVVGILVVFVLGGVFVFLRVNLPTPQESVSASSAKIDLLYPPPTVNRNTVTAVIKLNLVSQALVPSEFLSVGPYAKFFSQIPSEDEYKFVYFTPGRMKNLTITFNGTVLDSHGFSTLPYIPCVKRVYMPDGARDERFKTEQECIKQSSVEVLAFVNLQLQKGSNEVEITREDSKTSKRYSIVFDPEYVDKPSSLPLSPNVAVDERFSFFHNCTSLLEGPFLAVPLVKTNENAFYYRMSFPQTKSERGNVSKRLVNFAVEGNVYDVILPSLSRYNKVVPSEDDLNLPLDFLVFQNGAKAVPSQMLPTDPLPDASHPYPGIYLEMVPFDRSNTVYPHHILPWGTINSSSCDG